MALISNGTTVFDNGSMASGFGGSMVLIKKLTASSSQSLNFVHGTAGVDLTTYKEYMFTFNNLHSASDTTWLQLKASTNGGSSYGVSCTSTNFLAHHNEGDGNTGVNYYSSRDHANDTGYIYLAAWEQGSDNDQSTSGMLKFYNPSNTTFQKHWLCTLSICHPGDFATDGHASGYFNTTSAINAIGFTMTSGNIDSGDICLYGIA